MGNRLDLQSKFEEFLGSRHVYFQPPENTKIEYPAIIYSRSDIFSLGANNTKYSMFDCYDVIVIDRLPDNKAIKKILGLPMSSFERHYKSDNLNHDLIKLYF